MIPINIANGPSPNLSLEARHRQLAMLKIVKEPKEPIEYRHLSREDFVLIVEILRADCARLRRELDDLRGITR